MDTHRILPPELIVIAALARDRVIGKENRLLWHLPEDMRHFKALTQGHPVIMGRKTWESLPDKFRPLPGRKNIVITRNSAYLAPGAVLAETLDAALAACADASLAFVIGGAEIYALALPRSTRMELTEIDAEYAGDAWFPAWDPREWQETTREARHHDSADGNAGCSFDYAFVRYQRVADPSRRVP
jgi:dihydrofolate reductase